MKKIRTLMALILGLSLAFISCKSGSDSGSSNDNFEWLIGTWTATALDATTSSNGGAAIPVTLENLGLLGTGDFQDTMVITQSNLNDHKNELLMYNGQEHAAGAEELQMISMIASANSSTNVVNYSEIKFRNSYTVNENKTALTITGSTTIACTVNGTQQRVVSNYTITYTKQQ